MDEIGYLIENNSLLNEDDYFDFLDLKEIIKYLLNNIDLFLKHLEFILELLKTFDEIIVSKLKIEHHENRDDENLKYEFYRKKEYFYTHIYI